MNNKRTSMIRFNLSSGGSVLIPFQVYMEMTDEDFLDLECRQFSSGMKYIVSDEFQIDDEDNKETYDEFLPDLD